MYLPLTLLFYGGSGGISNNIRDSLTLLSFKSLCLDIGLLLIDRGNRRLGKMFVVNHRGRIFMTLMR